MKKILLITSLFLGPFNEAFADMKTAMAAYEKGDIATALKEFTTLAVKGDPTAQNNLGVLYSNGELVKKNLKKAAKWYRLAAEQGLAIAQVNMGHFYETGQGFEKDLNTALVWYQLAAEQGYDLAQFHMGRLQAEENNGNSDKQKAYFWLSLTVKATNDESIRQDALDLRKKVAKKMTKKEIVEAEFIVETWRAQH